MNEENEEFEREMNYKSPSQVVGDSVAREFADGQEDEDGSVETAKYITVLDFETGRVFQYEIGVNDVEGDSRYEEWNPDQESCEEYLNNEGHNLGNCEWMVHDDSKIWADHSVGQVIMKECH